MAELLSLPDELLVMILSYCTSIEHLQISQVCLKLNELTCDHQIIKVVKINHNEIFSPPLLSRFLTFSPRVVNINTIDLTSCYWLTSSFILNLVSRLKELENVLVADTPLLSKHLRQLLKTLPKVKRISWTWRNDMIATGYEEDLKKLQFLYLCIHDSKSLQSIVHWLRHCVELKEVWVNNYIRAPNDLRSMDPIELQHLEEIVLYPCPTWPSIKPKGQLKRVWHCNTSIVNLREDEASHIETLFSFQWQDISHVIELGTHKIERICCLDNLGPDIKLLSELQGLKALSCVLHPHTVLHADSLLSLGQTVQELGLECGFNGQEPSKMFCEFASACTKLKRLSLPIQALVSDIYWMNYTFEQEGSLSKRVSRVKDSLPDDVETPFRNMVQATPLVEVFEIGIAGKDLAEGAGAMPLTLQWDFASLSSIGNWRFLKSLTLGNMNIQNAKFFSKILRDCKQLKSLKVMNLGPGAVCNYSQDLYSALPYCQMLQDFHWIQGNVGSTSKLWSALQLIPTLQRVALGLRGSSSLEESDVYETVEKCKSLYFLYIASSITKVKANNIKRTVMSRWSNDRPHLVVWLGTPEEFVTGAESCPKVHAAEMIQEIPNVKGVPAYCSRHLSFGFRAWAPYT